MHYYLYQVKHIKSGKIYIGVHETNDLDDDYFGSGKLIKRAIKKHGKDEFEKTILEVFRTKEEMYAREADVVNEEFLNKDDVYNLGAGGSGGTIKQNRKSFSGPHKEEAKRKIGDAARGRRYTKEQIDKRKKADWSKTRPEEQRKHAKKAALIGVEKRKADPNSASQIRQKISETLKERNRNLKDSGKLHPVSGIKRDKIKCPHCGKEGASNTMSRWHFDNCKSMVLVR